MQADASVQKPAHGLPRLDSLDGLRGLLAVYVVCFHMLAAFPLLRGLIYRHTDIFNAGWFAVDVFFVLSGFVMSYVYGKAFTRTVAARPYRTFMLARVARIYPLHLLTLAVLAVRTIPFHYRTQPLFSLHGPASYVTLLANVLMLQGPWVPFLTWNYPSWSISSEFHAYLVFPFLVPLLRARQAAAAALLVSVAIVLILFLAELQRIDLASPRAEFAPTNGLLSLLHAVPLFLAGMCAFSLRGWARRHGNGLALLGVAGPLVLLNFAEASAFAVLFVVPLVYGALYCAPVTRFLESRPALFLGRVSFSLYMIHAVVIILLWRVHGLIARAAPARQQPLTILTIALGIGLCIALAYCVNRWVEVPLREQTLRLFGARRARSRAGAETLRPA